MKALREEVYTIIKYILFFRLRGDRVVAFFMVIHEKAAVIITFVLSIEIHRTGNIVARLLLIIQDVEGSNPGLDVYLRFFFNEKF